MPRDIPDFGPSVVDRTLVRRIDRQRWIVSVTQGDRALHVGGGHTPVLLAREGVDVVALSADAATDAALGRERQAIRARVKLMDGVLQDLPEAAAFDTVILEQVWRSAASADRLIAAAAGRLVEGGVMILTAPLGPTDDPADDAALAIGFVDMTSAIETVAEIAHFAVVDGETRMVARRPAADAPARKLHAEALLGVCEDALLAQQVSARRTRWRDQSLIDRLAADLESAQDALCERDLDLNTLRAGAAGNRAAMSALQAGLTTRDAALKAAQDQLAARDAALKAAQDQLAARDAALKAAQADLAARDAALKTAQDQLAARAAALKAAQADLAARDAAPPIGIVGEDGAALSDAALARLVEALSRAPLRHRLAPTPERVAALCTDIAKRDFAADPTATLVLASLAQRLDPRPWREKWLAFALNKAGFGAAAARRLALLGDDVALSDSERRARAALAAAHPEAWRAARGKATTPDGAPAAIPADRRRSASGGPLRVACVADPFTRRAFAPEWTLQDLTPERWAREIEAFDPDLVFIESAWQGVDGAWKARISSAAPELRALIAWCRERGLPTAFWNKEDPVHFATFLDAARMADFIFTTDLDCIPRYRHAVGHDRVFLLPFALQPKFDTPLATIPRKPGFNFAGSYYLRYPERQRDFDRMISVAEAIGPVTIYDRNFDRPHPHYTFPDKFKKYILGSLPPEQISQAYKGYKYGLNMSTIKQSQTMFARRVFELMGSNTIVVSNFARGLRMLFGDLAISTDDAAEARARIEALERDPIRWRKLRLMALRKALREHTYAHRAAFVAEKTLGIARDPNPLAGAPEAIVTAVARDARESAALIATFRGQRHPRKTLFLATPERGPEDAPDIRRFADAGACAAALRARRGEGGYLCLFSARDWHGPEYLGDLLAARLYAEAPVFAKASLDAASGEDPEYRALGATPARAAAIRFDAADDALLARLLANPEDAVIVGLPIQALDAFNYLRDGADRPDAAAVAGDLTDIDQGLSMRADIELMAEAARALTQWTPSSAHDIPRLPTAELARMFAGARRSGLTLKAEGDALTLVSKLAPGKHGYLYAAEALPREALNLVDNSQIRLEAETTGGLDLRTVFEFQNADGVKLSHNMQKAGGDQALTIPPDCRFVRLGLRAQGPGAARIGALLLGAAAQRPALLFSGTRRLVLTKQYPAPDDLYRYGFLHSRVRGYRAAGMGVDVFRLSAEGGAPFRSFEGVDVMTGDAAQLDALLASGRIEHVMAHLIDAAMWDVLSRHLDRVAVTVWVHGAEVQHWRRRAFEFERLPSEEIARQKALSDQRMIFWRGVMQNPHPNLRLVFVSRYFAEEVMADVGVRLPDSAYRVIHNPIDTDLFAYHPKSADQRAQILSIRPYASRKYANDLSVAAILRLAEQPFFSELSFRLIGDGPLFEETLAPLRGLANVTIERRFLTQPQIAALHRAHGVFLCPTRMDSQGVSRDEAMASGLVPVTSAVAAVPEFVDEDCGVLAPPEDADALAEGIAGLYRDPERFLRLSAAAAARVRRQSAADIVIPREIALVERRS